VYEGLWALTHRDFATAGATLLDSVATFTAHEVVGYRTFVFYAVLAGLKTLERPALKKRVVDSPDVLSSIEDVPHLGQLLNAFYEGRYRDFLQVCSVRGAESGGIAA
jgi:26S proteasome regulatory subunit N7